MIIDQVKHYAIKKKKTIATKMWTEKIEISGPMTPYGNHSASCT